VSENTIKLLLFNLNNESFAIDIMQVERILGYVDPTVIPDAPAFVKGVINYEGMILPIINLGIKFHLIASEIEENTKIIVTKYGGTRTGIIVDLVSEVLNANLGDIETPPDIMAGISKRYIKGLIKRNDKIIIFLDMSNVLTEEEKKLI
jgi:purine-binding chemotaxis protein CheW